MYQSVRSILCVLAVTITTTMTTAPQCFAENDSSALQILRRQTDFSFKSVSLGKAISQISSIDEFKSEGRYILNFGEFTYGKLKDQLACHMSAVWMRGSDLEGVFKRASGLQFSGDPAKKFSTADATEKSLSARNCTQWEWDPDANDDQGPGGTDVCVEYGKPYPIGVELILSFYQANTGSAYIKCQRKSDSFSDSISASEFDRAFGKYLNL